MFINLEKIRINQRELLRSEVNNRDMNSAIEVNNDTIVYKNIEKFPLLIDSQKLPLPITHLFMKIFFVNSFFAN